MATRTETRQIRLAQWGKIFEEKAASGLTAKEFCAINNISRDAYYYWQNLARQEALSKAGQPALVELKPPAVVADVEMTTAGSGTEAFKPQITVTINNASINVDSNTPKELLAMVLEVLSDVK